MEISRRPLATSSGDPIHAPVKVTTDEQRGRDSASLLASSSRDEMPRRGGGELPARADALREIWADVLDIDIEDVTPEAHFFELGGDSLLTAELVRDVTARGMLLSRHQVFQTPLFADMAVALVLTSGVVTGSAAVGPGTGTGSQPLPPFQLIDGDGDGDGYGGVELEQERQLAAAQCGVPADDIVDMYPTTALQAGLMARSLSLTVSAPGAYVSTWLLKCLQRRDPHPDSAWLCRALERLVHRLPILCTAFVPSAEHSFIQVVLPPPSIAVVRVRSRHELDVYARQQPVMGLGNRLTKIEVVVSEDCNQAHVLWHVHHAVYDMSTVELLAQHLDDIVSGRGALPSPPSFASFIAHSLDVRKSPEWRHFWAEQLEDCPVPCFPSTGPGNLTAFRTNTSYTHILPLLAATSGFTLPNLFRAAWAFLLMCYEHSGDVVFGVTNGGRYAPVPRCAEIVGPTITTTPMRVSVKPTTTIRDFLQQLSIQAVEINSFEQVGLSLIQQQLGADGRTACNFRSLVNVQTNDGKVNIQFFELADPEKAEPLDYALVLELFPRNGGAAALRLSYDNRILRHPQVAQIAVQLEQVLQLFVTNPNRALILDVNVVPLVPSLAHASHSRFSGQKSTDHLSTSAHQLRKHAAVECGISEAAIQDVYPCTPMQADLINVSLEHPTTYVSQIVFRVREDLSNSQVLDAWAALYKRAETLRTRFFRAPMGLLQAVVDEEISWRASLDLEEYLTRDRELAFDLGDLFARFALIHDPSGEKIYQIVLTAHHAVYDASNTHAMLQILDGVVSRTADHVSTTPFSYFVRHAARSLNDASTAFWARTFEGCPTPSFPAVTAGQTPLSTANVHKEVKLPVASTVQTSQTTTLMQLQAAWALTLTQYYDSNDVTFGMSLSGPGVAHTDVPIVGPAVTIVPQRIKIENPEASIADFLHAVEKQNLALLPHAQYGLSNIKAIDESCAAACSFQNLFVARSVPDVCGSRKSHDAFQQVSISPSVENGKGDYSRLIYNFAIVVEVTLANSTAKVSMSYDPSILVEVEVQRLVSHYEHVLLQICGLPITGKGRVRDIQHVSDAHVAELLSWNSTIPAPLECGVHELFEDQVAAQPDSPAVCARDGEWTYSQLDEVSEKFARVLRSLSVGPGTYVPLLFEKSGFAIIAMLAILKAGGASVALDPSHPPERLQNLIGGMGECTIICSRKNHLLATGMAHRALVLDCNTLRELSQRPSLPRLSKESHSFADRTAFVLFTSGSTGMPKGILIPHRSFSSSIRGHSQVLRFTTGPGSRNFQFTAYTSDVSIGEIFTSLAVGSCICVPSEWDRKNNLAGAMRDFKVNWAFFTPSVATLISPSDVPLLRTLVFGGETASPENIQTWAPALHLINSFGPAECSIWTHCIPRPVMLDDFGSNIGYGVGCATWITDPTDYHRLLPIGAIGEMLVEGPNIANGYLNDPVKTSDTFVHDPMWMPASRKSMRLYRSGDLARYLPNGMVQFLGRRDHQVKLRGLRVELGEIEHQIRKLLPDDMLVAVDIVSPYPAGSARVLAAFIAPMEQLSAERKSDNDPATVDPEKQKVLSLLLSETSNRLSGVVQGMEIALGRVLPSHMVPAAFVPLREMPLTASAKTDRKVLKLLASMVSAEELSRLSAVTKTKQAPSMVMEFVLARLWSAALVRSLDLDVNDSFYKVGGDSLSAMRLVSLARKDGIQISVEQVLRNPTLREMAQVALVEEEDGSRAVGSDLLEDVAAFGTLEDDAATASAIKSASTQLGVADARIEDIYPCTPLQEGLLALSQDARGSYVAQMVYELPSDIDLPQLESAWTSVLEDWPILRTRFFQWYTADGISRSMQAVVRKSRTRWLRSRSLSNYLKLDKRDRMQLGDNMLRLAAFQDEGDEKYYLVMTAHHAIYDGWMLGLLFTALRRAYLNLPKVGTTPYNVFINYLATRDHERSQIFWQNYVSDASRPSWPELPSLDFRPRSTSVCKKTVAFPHGGHQNFTPTTLIRSAFGILIGAYSHIDDVVFASSVYGRALGQFSAEKICGPTIATVPVRVRVGRERKVYELMATVQSDVAGILTHEQEGMQNIKRYNRNALATIDAQSLLVVQIDQQPQDHEVEGLKLRPVAGSGLDNGFLSSALVLEVTISGEVMHLVATHDDRVLSPRQADRFLRQMSHIVCQLCNVSDHLCLADLELIPLEDAEEMYSWNANVPAPAQTLLHELVFSQAQEQPDAEALVSWEGSLTYLQLDEISNQLAGHLWTVCGLRSGIRVPLLFEKSMWTVVAMLAVLKIGAANVALNPAHPSDRLRSLIEDVDADFVLCSQMHQSLAQDIAPRNFCVGPATVISGLEGKNEVQEITPDAIAFLLFTSGSTGKPKAIMIDHTAFCSSINGHGEVLCYRKGSRNLQFTAYTSDVSIGEIFTSLSRGATVCIPSDSERMNDLAGAMERMRVDWAFLTPSVGSLLNPDHVPTLKTLLFGGETATVTNVQTWAPRVHLINSFGPAETSIWSHAHPHFKENDDGSDIGWSLGCATWIVDPDDYDRLMPIGAIGELIVEGPNIAAGYYKNPEKTQAAFVKRLSWLPPDRRNRIYRLGDLARWMPDGRVQFLGRKDGQVKLYGQRVEVGEVEHNIRVALGDEGLEVAVEMMKNPEQFTDSRLIAFISCTPANQTQDRDHPAIISNDSGLQHFRELTDGLKSKLATQLATHMVPSFFVPLTSMPLSASAKTDRKVLRGLINDMGFSKLASFALASQQQVEPPQSPMEKLLHTMWCSILALQPDEFGVEADFFECGGDSIAAMKMASLARASNASLSVQDIYEHPRLRDLASSLEEKEPRSDRGPSDIAAFSLLPSSLQTKLEMLLSVAGEICSIEPDQIVDIYPCTPMQRTMIERTIASPGAYWLHNIFEVPPEVDVVRLEQAWELVVTAHAILRTRIFAIDGHHLQVVLRSPDTLQHIAVASINQFLRTDHVRERTYGQALLRAMMLTESGHDGGKRYFVLVFHHSTYDAWSLTKIFAVLERVYTGLADPDKAHDHLEEYREVGFKYFVKALQDQDRPLTLDFWGKYLLGAKTKPFASIAESGDCKVNCILRHQISLPSTGAQKGGGNTITPAVMAYAAVGLALHQQLQTSDTVMRLVSIGRIAPSVPDIEALVGPTMTMVPLRINHTGKVSLQEYLSHVQAQVRRLTPFDQTGYEEVSRVHADADHACRDAPQVIVHPHDPYSEQPAAQLGLLRRELSAFGDTNIPLTIDISLRLQGKALEALDIRAIFDDRVVAEDSVRRLVADLEIIMQRVSSMQKSNSQTATVLEVVQGCGSEEGLREKENMSMTVERIENHFLSP
ncbi:hypothetical protein BKA64DRAFT_685650 [Cadophora sp. MPI-SDFR-AT-0126]|nr:hypothetical protein BKA64DRAFT_685650 [Leotiomycetes sp. MPI-SDFR-AT-0126]